ncbi:hypothetical protein B9Z55_021580 [Caenorhabditis nigoni]|uniref:F-box domain-containing protein n=1 Tax=Caenorhabditis nigoni TaxID=1611254 RepID=A0A2G5TSQ3_9PELO|nr:hypothetical protein B9Z55_021580 [Caenorhabditis nigoni]
MPINILSLPVKDLQYALDCMDLDDLLAFSLCSKRAKNLVKSSKVEVEKIYAEVDENRINLKISTSQLQKWIWYGKRIKFVLCEDFSIKFKRVDGFQKWENTEFTFNHLIAHFLSLSNTSMIRKLKIKNGNSIAYLDTVKQLIPKCQFLKISEECSREFTKIAFLKLSSIGEIVEIDNNPLDNENYISKLLSLNLKSVIFNDFVNPFKLTLDDLLGLNIARLTIASINITERELNRFLKLWMKSSHGFYRPEHISLLIRNGINRAEVLRGIKYQIVDNKHLLKRADGKELLIDIGLRYVIFKFRQ